MIKLKQLDDSAFLSKYKTLEKTLGLSHDSVYCVSLPFSSNDIAERFGITFQTDDDDDWLVDLAVIDFDGDDNFLLLARYMTEPIPETFVVCSTLAQENAPEKIVKYILSVMGITNSDLVWFNSDILTNDL